MINLLPLAAGETISTVMPLPEDEESWASLTVMFATAAGYVRRNALSDFVDVRANGKIAMKFEGEDADDRLIAVATCTDAERCAAGDARRQGDPLPGRGCARLLRPQSSVGVRGISLLGDDAVISMSILRHEEVSSETRDAYIKLGQRAAPRRTASEEASSGS